MALVPIIVTAAKVAQTVYRHRKAIYAVLTAQDRYISNSFRYGGYGKATSYGVRSGALIGSVAGAFISNADDSPGNGVQKPLQKQHPPSKPYKTRSGRTSRNNSRYSTQRCYGARSRNSRSRKY